MSLARRCEDHPTLRLHNWPKNIAIDTSETRLKGLNRSRGEALETVHHLYSASQKRYIDFTLYESFRSRYHECVRMLNRLERKLELQLAPSARRFPSPSESDAGI